MKLELALAAAVCGALPCAAQPAPDAPVPVVQQAEARAVTGSIVDIEIVETLNSKTHKRGDTFAIRLARPIVVDGVTLVPAGATGRGEVISASSAGMMGKAGELLLAARYLEHEGRKIPLRSFKLGMSGQDNTSAVMLVSTLAMVSPVAMLAIMIPGGDIEIRAGTPANAKLAADVTAPAPTPASN